MSAASAFSVGDTVEVDWHGSWWPAEIVRINKDKSVLIHYVGYDSSSDEIVTMNRIRQPEAGEAGTPPPPPPGPVGASGLEALLIGEPVSAKTPLQPGDKVTIDWNGSWWAGEVVAVHQDGGVRVHYAGWESKWDETVPRSRLQLPSEKRKPITIHFDRGWSITGTLVKVVADGYVISRAEDHKLCLVSRQNVAYFELDRNEDS